MAIENSLAVFSLRLPRELAQKIDARTKVTRRNRNAEIVLLLEIAMDLQVENDKKILAAMKAMV